jgi:hypothetical protein
LGVWMVRERVSLCGLWALLQDGDLDCSAMNVFAPLLLLVLLLCGRCGGVEPAGAAGAAGAAGEAELERRGLLWAESLDPSAERFIKGAAGFITEVGDFLEMGEGRKKALVLDSRRYGVLRYERRMAFLRSYYKAHWDVVDGPGRWDFAFEQFESAGAESAWRPACEELRALLRRHLTVPEMARWEGELAARRARFEQGHAKAKRALYEGWVAGVKGGLEGRLREFMKTSGLPADRLPALGAAVKAGTEAYEALALPYWKKMVPDATLNPYYLKSSYLGAVEQRGLAEMSERWVAKEAAGAAFDKKLRGLLTGEEIALMEGRQKAVDKEVGELMSVMQDAGLASETRERGKQAWLWEEEVKAALSLDAGLAAALHREMESEHAAQDKEWRRLFAAENGGRLREMVATQSDSIAKIRSGRMWFGSSKAQEHLTKEGGAGRLRVMEKVLSVEQRAALKVAMLANGETARDAMLAMLVSELDLVLNLLPEQRAALHALCKREIKGLERLPGGWGVLGEWAYGKTLLCMANGLPELEVKKLLDGKQFTGFKALCEESDYEWRRMKRMMDANR